LFFKILYFNQLFQGKIIHSAQRRNAMHFFSGAGFRLIVAS
jgi:hypothetical protein